MQLNPSHLLIFLTLKIERVPQNEFSISSINGLGLIIISQGAKLTNPLVYEEIKTEFTLMKKQLEKDPSKQIC